MATKTGISVVKLILIIFIVLGLDQLTKFWANIRFSISPWVPVPWFSFIYSENEGIAFGLPLGGPLLIVVSLVLMIGLLVFAFKMFDWRKYTIIYGLGLIIGGAVGNTLDRILGGVVRDFISIGFWPTFNIADAAIVCGVVLLLHQSFFDKSLK
ncbi:MAG: lipoprotein signal peptidase, signal peptidase II [Candidatus Peregrinibacteria bacterium GW2011_GWE2_39_6]|nr:MAG: lipoprotein signal peptidase, signal peptidase II [Candidatus Peregrinibacteria bacterium GW2011_GWF2_39_17]KKR24453.1 MAG: lipoprotein signal peptidase, signal peptidase II [Candidatus Peregrinibacteria bacterium GW2011_GWE2_39_6]HCW31953.1 signal peptidase II [Candidatus Peregrinibacteria bacterium]